ncbi:hypothetical protein Cni_G15032 [Canna indica]|uniref:Uncharacterized protein n=1 Tax=Canna indica TaxID=4628 RepID=A0AAQ3QFA8_9LILI|nr:hypothetical protein Cni_G15032 [Canna indica]
MSIEVIEISDDDDCCVLPYNPFSDEQRNLARRLSLMGSPPPNEVAIIAERGQFLLSNSNEFELKKSLHLLLLVETIPTQDTCVQHFPSARQPIKDTAGSVSAMYVINELPVGTGTHTAMHATSVNTGYQGGKVIVPEQFSKSSD